MEIRDNERLTFHLSEVLAGTRRFENAAQSVSRMILEKGVDKVMRGGKPTYDFGFFRQGREHIVGWFGEANEFVNFVKNAAEGGPSKQRAFVLVGEPGNGKTFFVEYVCTKYRRFLTHPENRRYTFEFSGLEKLKVYGNIRVIQSQTFEDPLILAMNLFETPDESRERFSQFGFDDRTTDRLWVNYRPLGACTEYIWNDIRSHCDGDVQKMLEFIRIVAVPIAHSSGIITGKYSA